MYTELLAHFTIQYKTDALRRMLNDYRNTHSISVTDPEYYGAVLLDALQSWMRICNINILSEFNSQDPLTILILICASRNDNIILRMIAFYYAHLTLQQLQAFEVWTQPLDLS